MKNFLVLAVITCLVLSCNVENEKPSDQDQLSDEQSIEVLLNVLTSQNNNQTENYKKGTNISSYFLVKNLRNGVIVPVKMDDNEAFVYEFALGLDGNSKQQVKSSDGKDKYVVTCSGGSKDGKSTSHSTATGAAGAVKACLDGGGCAEVCAAPDRRRRIEESVGNVINKIDKDGNENEDLLKYVKSIEDFNTLDSDEFTSVAVTIF